MDPLYGGLFSSNDARGFSRATITLSKLNQKGNDESWQN